MSTTFRVGSSVVLVGLQRNSELNGKAGMVSKFDSKSKRWEVDIRGVGFRRIRSENLQQTPQRRQKERWCKYGQQCFRPHCWSIHTNEASRCTHFADILRQRSADHKCVYDEADLTESSSAPDLDATSSPCANPVSPSASPRMSVGDIEARITDIEAKYQELMMSTLSSREDCDAKLGVDKYDRIKGDIAELADITSSKYCEFENRFEQRTIEMRDELHELVRNTTSSLIDEKLNIGVQKLVLGAMKAALTPLAVNFEERMLDFEQRIFDKQLAGESGANTCMKENG